METSKYDFRKIASSKPYVAKYSGPIQPRSGVGSTLTLYGPYATVEDAYEANLYSLPEPKKGHAREWYAIGVFYYDDGEIKSLLDDPAANDLEKIVLRKPSALKDHKDWASMKLKRHGYFMYVHTGDSKFL